MAGESLVSPALVLRRRPHRESDRVCALYTREHGKLLVRFPGVDRSLGKLKAASEPLASGDYRLFLSGRSETAVCTGAALGCTFPGLRRDLDALLRGLELCELLDSLTPLRQPNPLKFELALESLRALEEARGREGRTWVLLAFGLRLLEAAGYGTSALEVSEPNRPLWRLLHEDSLGSVSRLSPDPGRQGRLASFLLRSVERVTEKPLRSALLRSRLLAPAAEVVPA